MWGTLAIFSIGNSPGVPQHDEKGDKQDEIKTPNANLTLGYLTQTIFHRLAEGFMFGWLGLVLGVGGLTLGS